MLLISGKCCWLSVYIRRAFSAMAGGFVKSAVEGISLSALLYVQNVELNDKQQVCTTKLA